MDLPAAWFQTCVCGQSFSVPQAYTCHKRTCQKKRKRLAGALENLKAKGVWQARKRQKVDAKAAEDALQGPLNLNNVPEPFPTGSTPAPQEVKFFLQNCFCYVD